MTGRKGNLGLQWRLSAIYLAVGLLSTAGVVAGFHFGTWAGLSALSAWALGAGAGLAAGVGGSWYGVQMARSLKLRLWEAGDMAGRIARGDFAARLASVGDDELGWLEAQLNRMADHLEEAVGDLQRLAEQNRRLTEEAGRGAALEERARLARDLHDTVNQQLFVLTMRTAAARRRLEQLGGEAEALAPELRTLEELSRQAHGEARKLILQLRPTTLEQQGLGPALTEYVRTAAAKEGWELHDEVDTAIRFSGPEAENLFRVAQEALNNIAKHAGASSLWVSLQREEERVVLRVRDDGHGFDPRAGMRPTAVGLIGMRERVAGMGGALRVISAPGEGTEVNVWIPWPQEGGANP